MIVAKIDDRMYVVRDDYPSATSFKPIIDAAVIKGGL